MFHRIAEENLKLRGFILARVEITDVARPFARIDCADFWYGVEHVLAPVSLCNQVESNLCIDKILKFVEAVVDVASILFMRAVEDIRFAPTARA